MRYWVLPPSLNSFLLLLPSIAIAWQGKVVEVTDWDTLVIIKGNKEVDVLHYGIDTPETDQPYGLRATRFTKMMACFERVVVEQEGLDQYERHGPGLSQW